MQFWIYQQNSWKIPVQKFIFKVCSSKSINKILEKYLQRNPFLRYVVPNLSTKFLKNTCREIQILESCSASMNKIFHIHLWSNSFFFFSLPYKVYSFLAIFMIFLNASHLKCLISVSVIHLLETPCLLTWCLMKTK